ncbi:MAG: T9SS type A sorting domain-containing protein [Crocinitomicaceae bacterium]
MKYLLCTFFLFPIISFSQFAFELNNDIDVIVNNIQLKYPWVGGLDAPQYSNIDLNFDGVQDLFIFERSTEKVLTFLQNGAPGQIDFIYAPQYESDFPKLNSWALLVDYDGDGKKDIFSYNYSSASVFRNTGNQGTGLSFVLQNQTQLPATFLIDGILINSIVFMSSIDIPAITDIDNDGDIDILAFGSSVTSACITYHKNLSQELYGNNSALEFKASSVCYGNFWENSGSNLIELGQCCYNQVDNPETIIDIRPTDGASDRHTGSTVLSLDLDADNMQDLIIGDNQTSNLVRLMNANSVPNTNIDMISPDYAFPSYDVPVDVDQFPGAYYVDINNDNIRDLIVAPNTAVESNNYQANWMYKSDGLDNNPDFSLQTKGFLQDDMVDGGGRSYPVYFDHNGDGLKDLIVSIGDRYDSVSANGYSQLFYYENTGTANIPEFTLVDKDYGNFSNFLNRPHEYYRPAFGDADGDGDKDLLLNDSYDTMYYFENISGAGNIAQFVNATPFKNNLGQVIDEGLDVTPKFIDLNRDGKMDLVFGKKNGKISYYENQGGTSNYDFVFKTASLGDVNVAEGNASVGVAVPEFFEIDGEYHLICGAKNGFLHYYTGIDGNLTSSFNLEDSTLEDINIGSYSTPLVYDIDNDNRFEMLVGNKRGGVVCYQSAIITDVGLNDFKALNDVNIYPNPADTYLIIDLSKLTIGSYELAKFTLSDVSGRLVLQSKIDQTKTNIDCKDFSKGVYFLSVNVDGQLLSRKIVID